MYSIHLDNCFGPAGLKQLSKGMEYIISQESKQLRHYLYIKLKLENILVVGLGAQNGFGRIEEG